MELKDDEFQTLRTKVDQISSELEKQHAIRVVNTKWMIIVGSLILAALGFTSFVQVPNEARKAAEKQVGPAIINTAKEIISELQTKKNKADDIFEQLSDETAKTIQPDTLAFFDRSDCPEGWEEFEKGAGRFLIGKGGDYTFEKEGGKAEVSLEEKHMPPHEHKLPVYIHGTMDKNQLKLDALQGAPKKGNYFNNPRSTDKRGKGEPHPNMPPFLALTLCRKR